MVRRGRPSKSKARRQKKTAKNGVVDGHASVTIDRFVAPLPPAAGRDPQTGRVSPPNPPSSPIPLVRLKLLDDEIESRCSTGKSKEPPNEPDDTLFTKEPTKGDRQSSVAGNRTERRDSDSSDKKQPLQPAVKAVQGVTSEDKMTPTKLIAKTASNATEAKTKGRGTKAASQKKATSNRNSSGSAPDNKKKSQNKTHTKKLTEYFPVRKSYRVPEGELKKERMHMLESCILRCTQDGLKVVEFSDKGRGVVATRQFHRGDFVVEYRGELIDAAAAREREEQYRLDPNIGCYMYYFEYKGKHYCIDATEESGHLGRLVNHSAKDPNCVTKIVEIKDRPYLILIARKNVTVGEELLYDYGDRSKAAILHYPWLVNS